MIRRLSLLLLCAWLQALTPAAAALHASQHLAGAKGTNAVTSAMDSGNAETACPEHAAHAAAVSDVAHQDSKVSGARHGCCAQDCHCVAPALGAVAAMRLPATPPLHSPQTPLSLTALTEPALRQHLRPPISA